MEEKCRLAENYFLSNIVKCAQKEVNVLNWLLKSIIEKFAVTDGQAKTELLPMLWKLLMRLVKTPNFENYFITASQEFLWDFLNAVMDNLSDQETESNECVQFMKIIFKQFKHLRRLLLRNHDDLCFLIAKCVKHPIIQADALSLYEASIHSNNMTFSNQKFFELLLVEVLKTENPSHEIVSLVSKGLFSKQLAAHWTLFLKTSIHQPNLDQKPTCNDEIDSVFKKILSMTNSNQINAIGVLYKGAIRSNVMTDSSKAIFYAMTSRMLKLNPKFDDTNTLLEFSPLAETLFLTALESESQKDRIIALQEIIEYSVNMELDFSVIMGSEDQSWMKYLQYQLKYLLTEIKEESAAICKISLYLGNYCPIIIEPFIGALSSTIMTLDKTDIKVELMCKVIALFHKMRQFPKLIARLLIALNNGGDVIWNQDIINCFAEKVLLLPSGQLIETWKTFEYHIRNSSNLTMTLETLMPVFLLHASIIDKSIPVLTMNKFEGIIQSTRDAISTLKSLPKTKNAVEELCITLIHTREMKFIDLRSASILQKRKLDMIAPIESKKAKTILNWEDVKMHPNIWKVALMEMEDEELKKGIDELILWEKLSNELIEENVRALQIIVEKVVDYVKDNNPRIKYLEHLKSGVLIKLDSFFDEVSNLKIPSTKYVERMIKFLPLEHLQGRIEAIVTILSISLVRVDSCFSIIIARCLSTLFRSSTILKYLSATKLILHLSMLQNSPYYTKIIQSIIKLGLTYQAPLDELMQDSGEFSSKLKHELNDEISFCLSVNFLESLQPTLTDKIVVSGDDKRSKYEALFKDLSKALMKGLKNENKNINNSLIMRALTAIIDVLSFQGNSKKLKKWGPFVLSTYMSMIIDADRKSCNFKFLSVVLRNYEALREKLNDGFFKNIIHSKFYTKPLESEEEKETFTLLIEATSRHSSEDFRVLINDMLELTIDRSVSSSDLQLLNNWKNIIKAQINEEILVVERRETIEKLLSSLLIQSVPINSNSVSDYYLPLLTFQASLLDLDKPILFKETEAFCVSTSVLIKLEPIFEDCPNVFDDIWLAIYNVLSTTFHKRPSSILATRIPLGTVQKYCVPYVAKSLIKIREHFQL